MKFDRSIFIGKFTQEAQELLQKLDHALIQLEKEPQNSELLKEIFRVAHTLKGSSKILRFDQVSQLSHSLEELLTAIQDGQVALTEELIGLLFLTTDSLKHCIQSIQGSPESVVTISPIINVLTHAVDGDDISIFLAELHAKHQDEPLPETETSSRLLGHVKESHEPLSPDISNSSSQKKVNETIRVDVERLDSAIRLIGEIAVSHQKSSHTLSALKELQRLSRRHVKQLHHLLHHTHIPSLSNDMETALLTESTDVMKGIEQAFKDHRDEMALLDIVISELYDDALAMQMLPLSVIFDTFPRAVRDMAHYFHKEIELQIHGEETVLDKKIIEELTAPLIHLLRNCVDHGIEPPEERQAKGKSPKGTVQITASQKSGHIRIEIVDDGQGIQTELLKQRAVQRQMISEEDAAALAPEDVLNLAFLPRLSTSEMITDISGRGVGMDIVKANLELLKGSIQLRSIQNQGTTIILTLPVTLSSLRSMIISSRQKLFAVPINAIEETLQIAPQDCIQVVGQQAIRVRNQIIYLVELAEVLGLRKTTAQPKEKYFVMIARTNGKRVGLIVDDILDEQDVVVKQLPGHMRKAKMIAGATISNHNSIILILHIPEVLEQLKYFPLDRQETHQESEDVQRPRLLVVDDSLNTGEIEKRILESCGYTVDLAKDGIEALEQIAQDHYDLIITDIEMPRMDGFTLTEHLRNMPEYAHIPIVIVTSLERESDRRRGLDVGANAYITKGHFEQRGLVETVKSLV